MQSAHPTTEELSALLDGESPPAEADAVRSHVETCAECRAELDQLRTTVALLRALPAAAPPRSFRVSEQHSRGRLLTFPLQRLASPVALRALAGVAAALMVVVFVADAARVDAPQAGAGVAALRAAPRGLGAASEAQPDQAATRQVPGALAPQRAPSSADGAPVGASSAAESVQAQPSADDSLRAPQPAPIAPADSAPAGPGGISTGRVAALAMALLAVGSLVVSFVARRPA